MRYARLSVSHCPLRGICAGMCVPPWFGVRSWASPGSDRGMGAGRCPRSPCGRVALGGRVEAEPPEKTSSRRELAPTTMAGARRRGRQSFAAQNRFAGCEWHPRVVQGDPWLLPAAGIMATLTDFLRSRRDRCSEAVLESGHAGLADRVQRPARPLPDPQAQ